MSSDDLTKDQAQKLHESIRPSVNFLYRLERRMEKARFKNDDPFYVAVRKAYDALHALSMKLHYMTCDGVGRPRKDDDAVDPKAPRRLADSAE